MKKAKVGVIIPAAGIGKRMNSSVPKQFLLLEKIPILIHTLQVFQDCKDIDTIVLAVASSTIKKTQQLIHRYGITKVSKIVVGGKERQDSVRMGCDAIKMFEPSFILVHDAVRPFVSESLVLQLIRAAKKYGAAIPAVPMKDTISSVDSESFLTTIPTREHYRNIQTPQAFRSEILFHAEEQARQENFIGTDESSLVHRLGLSIYCVESSFSNFKITTDIDFEFAKMLIKKRVSS